MLLLSCISDILPVRLNGFGAGFTGANANGSVEVGDENLAVADLAGACGIDDRLDDLLGDLVATASSILALGRKSTTYSAPRYSSV